MYFVLKDPDSIEDYSINWKDWLGTESLASAQWFTPPGLTLITSSINGTIATARVSGGEPGRRYTITCRAKSSTNRENDESIRIVCIHQ